MDHHKISDITLERFLLEELPDTEMIRVKAVLDQFPEEMERLLKLEESNREILERYPVRKTAAQIESRYEEKKAEKISLSDWLKQAFSARMNLAAPVLALLLLAVVLPVGYKMMQNPSQDIRLKGSRPGLFFYRKSGQETVLLQDSAKLKENDVLQIGYFASGKAYGMILSIDGRGGVTLHFPESVNSRGQLNPQKENYLPSAYQLDDAPGFEKFFFITADKPFDIPAVMLEASNLARSIHASPASVKPADLKLNLPEGLVQTSKTILKENPLK